MTFDSFGLPSLLLNNIKTLGYTAPTPIQTKAIPVAMNGRDCMGLAQTGTGKTAAFLLPIITRLMKKPQVEGAPRRAYKRPRALILAPTRELAEQIHESAIDLGRGTGVRSTTVYGGVNMNRQITALRQGVDIVVACPGRLLDHMGQRTVDLSKVEVLVLDEADQMFDMGFLPDIKKVLAGLPRERQTMLFSATMPDAIRQLATDILKQPQTVSVGHSAPAETVSHAIYPVAQHLKTALLLEMLKGFGPGSVLVFTRTKHRAKRLGEQLMKAGHTATALQGNLSQNRRKEAMDGFRGGRFRIMVATDIAARGIDVSLVEHVVNYDVPSTPETYTHRIGRTGRAERTGAAHTFVSAEDMGMVRAIERLLREPLERKRVPGFDYNMPAPRHDNEFARPPREPRNQRPQRADGPRRSSGGNGGGNGRSERGERGERGEFRGEGRPDSRQDSRQDPRDARGNTRREGNRDARPDARFEGRAEGRSDGGRDSRRPDRPDTRQDSRGNARRDGNRDGNRAERQYGHAAERSGNRQSGKADRPDVDGNRIQPGDDIYTAERGSGRPGGDRPFGYRSWKGLSGGGRPQGGNRAQGAPRGQGSGQR